MTCWITITKDDFFSRTSEIREKGGYTEFSSDMKTCTYLIDGTPYIQSQKYFNNTEYYQNLNAYEKEETL